MSVGVLIAAAAIAAFIVIIMLIPVTFNIYFRYNNELEKSISVKYGFIRIPLRRGGGDKPDKPEPVGGAKNKTGKLSASAAVEFVRREKERVLNMISAVLGYMFGWMIKIKKLNIKLVIGVEDAMDTALIFGSASAVIFNILGIIDNKTRLCEHNADIKPAFNNPHVFAELDAVICTNIFHAAALAVIALRHALPIYVRLKKTGAKGER